MKDKFEKELNIKDWKHEYPSSTPQQNNGYDCGVFACLVAIFLSSNKSLNFSQKDIPFYRKQMMLEIIYEKIYKLG